MKTARFVVFQDKKKQWRWHLKAANGRVIAQGEAHKRRADAMRAAETVKKVADIAQTPWLFWRAEKGQYEDGSSFMTVSQFRKRA